jgi:DNA invertase Pin-like site-specific DNA recombinase
MFTMLSVFAQFEQSLIRERRREGIALAKAKGTVYKGRKAPIRS